MNPALVKERSAHLWTMSKKLGGLLSPSVKLIKVNHSREPFFKPRKSESLPRNPSLSVAKFADFRSSVQVRQ